MYQLWILMQNNRCKQVWMDIFPYFKTKGKKKKKKRKKKKEQRCKLKHGKQ